MLILITAITIPHIHNQIGICIDGSNLINDTTPPTIITKIHIIVKKIFKFQACMSRISNVERSLLEKYDFNVLEFTTMKQMYDELRLLQQWSVSEDANIREMSDNILLIRMKELKFLEASRYASISNEIYNGYKALDQYLKEISKFQTVSSLRSLS